jgi:autoinducer 2 (AI-2) kinase
VPDKYVLAIDAGTSAVRCLVADLKGHIISLCSHKWDYQSPDDIAPLGKEFAPEEFWKMICDCVRQTLKKGGISAKDIIGIGATSQREGVVFLDKDGTELYAGPNIDLRALTEGISIDSKFEKEIYSITGHLPSFLFAPAKLKWFQANRPEIYKKIATVLSIDDWLIYRLCGERVSETCSASEIGLIDIRKRRWSNKLHELLALPRGIYPELVTAGSKVGKVTSQAASEIGITRGTAVAQGAPDAQCGLLGMGVKEKGHTGIIAGWSAPVQMVTDEPVFDSEARTWTSCHPFDGRWILESNLGEAGSAISWLKEAMFEQNESSEETIYGLMDKLALSVSPGADGASAFLGPSAMDVSHLGLKFGGFLFPIPMSAASIQRAHLVRAAMENLCFAIKANCRQLEEISGLKIGEVRLGGGLTKSHCLIQILPAVLNMPVSVSEVTDVSTLGVAMCAAVGSGVYASLEEAMTEMKPEMKVIEPERLSALEYAEHYQRWTSAAKWLEKLTEEMK